MAVTSQPPIPSRHPLRSLLFRGILVVVVGATLVSMVPGLGIGLRRPVEFLVWLAALAVTSLFSLPALRDRLDVNLSAPLGASAAVLFDPWMAVALGALGVGSPRELRRQAPLDLLLYNRAQIGVSMGLASWAAGLQPFGLILATITAVLVDTVANTVFVWVGLWGRRGMAWRESLQISSAPFPRFAMDFAITGLLALVVVIAYQSVGLWAIALLALPLWLGWSALRSARDAQDRAEELAERLRELESLHDAARDLLTARTRHGAATLGTASLRQALDRDDVEVRLDAPDVAGRWTLPVHGAEPAAVCVPEGLDERSLAVAESVAGMVGLALVRQQLEQDLAEVQRARAELAAQILEEGVSERSRMATELHDDVLPLLSGAEMATDNTRSALQVGSIEQADRLAAHAGDAIHAGIRRLREVLDAIQRQIIVPGGLHDGLKAALDELKIRGGVEGALDYPDDLPALPFAVEILLLDTARGCLANVANHAAANQVRVTVSADDARVRLRIVDDGAGFCPDEVPEGHHGLALMRQRAELARGSFEVDSTPGAGTTVEVEVPR